MTDVKLTNRLYQPGPRQITEAKGNGRTRRENKLTYGDRSLTATDVRRRDETQTWSKADVGGFVKDSSALNHTGSTGSPGSAPVAAGGVNYPHQ